MDDRDTAADVTPRHLWALSPETGKAGFDGTLWLTGGASLLLWTAIALLLTTA